MSETNQEFRAVILHHSKPLDKKNAMYGGDLHIWVIPETVTSREVRDLNGAAVDTLITALVPGGDDPDPWISDEYRVDQLLGEVSWARVDDEMPELILDQPVDISVRRRGAFRSVWGGDGEERVGVVIGSGEEVAEYPMDGPDFNEVLEAHGWTPGAQLRGWHVPTLDVAAANWELLIREATEEHERAHEALKALRKRWQILIREAVLDGQEVRSISQWAGITPQRVYQIRDRRR